MTIAEEADRKLARGRAVDQAYDALDGYKINRRRVVFVVNDLRRAGGYGVVRQAHLHTSPYLPACIASRLYGQPQVVAVKEIKLSPMYDASDLKQAFTKEVLVWSRLKGHPGVAEFLGFCADFDRSEAWLISPWVPYGNVSEFVRGRELEVPEKLSLASLRCSDAQSSRSQFTLRQAYDTIDALMFLHQLDPPVCHGDIKSANVLVNLECRAVLCDFGLARLYEDTGFGRLETSTGFKGSIRWCSPELLDGHPRTASSDIYAWAWLVWEIMTGELPYEGAGADYIIIRKIFESTLPQVNGESRLRDCLQVWELITRCWSVDLLQRPTSAMCKTTFEYLPHCPPTPKTADPHARSPALLVSLGELESWKGNHKAGFASLEHALHLYEEQGDDKGVASVLRKQAAVAYRDGSHVKTMNAASAALEKCRSLQDELGEADALFWIGCSLLMEDKRVDALPYLQDSLTIFRAKGNTVDLAKCLERLGELYWREEQTDKALSTLEEAVDIAARSGDRLGEARALIVLGDTHRDLDDMDRAISTLQRARDIARNIGWDQGLTTCLRCLGYIKLRQGIHAEAEELLREAVPVARRSDTRLRLGQALYNSGMCFQEQGRFEEAIAALEESCVVFRKLALDFDSEWACAAALLAETYSSFGRKEQALDWYDKTISEWRKGGEKAQISGCFAAKGVVLVDLDRCEEAALHFEASLVLDQQLGEQEGARWNQAKLSRVPKTVIKSEVGRQARLALLKVQSPRTAALLCDVNKLQRRVPQLTMPNLGLKVKLPVNGGGL